MSVYVDSPKEYSHEPLGYRGRPRAKHLWAHMTADTERELHEMAAAIGLRQEWYQGDHFDVVPAKRAAAIARGAIEVDRRGLIAAIRRLRASHFGPFPT